MSGVGFHEVIIETPKHNLNTALLDELQIINIVQTYKERYLEVLKDKRIELIIIFKNHGRSAGTSLEHPHSQLIATPCIPTILNQEKKASKMFWDKNCKCCFCDILDKEKKSPRFIWENNSFLVFTPWASVNPLEFWIMPKMHHSNMLDMSEMEKKDLAEVLRVSLGGLKNVVNDPPYNFGFHSLIDEKTTDYYHWHLEVYPRLNIWAGFEKSTGMFINVISPEDAALELRKSLKRNKDAKLFS